jgi:hypothetical protein
MSSIIPKGKNIEDFEITSSPKGRLTSEEIFDEKAARSNLNAKAV